MSVGDRLRQRGAMGARRNAVAHSSTSLSTTIVGVAHPFFQLSDIPISDRGTLEGLTQFRFVPPRVCRQAIGTTRLLRSNMREGRFCATLFRTARNLLILNGEMSEWLKEHAWKVLLATPTERHPRTATHIQISRLRPARAPRCEAVFVPMFRGSEACLTQFLHNS